MGKKKGLLTAYRGGKTKGRGARARDGSVMVVNRGTHRVATKEKCRPFRKLTSRWNNDAGRMNRGGKTEVIIEGPTKKPGKYKSEAR